MGDYVKAQKSAIETSDCSSNFTSIYTPIYQHGYFISSVLRIGLPRGYNE